MMVMGVVIILLAAVSMLMHSDYLYKVPGKIDVLAIFGILGALGGIISGIGILLLQPWARIGIIIVAVYSIAFTLVGYLSEPSFLFMIQTFDPSAVIALFIFTYFGSLIYVFTRQDVKARFLHP